MGLLLLGCFTWGWLAGEAFGFERRDPPLAVHRERPRFAFDCGAVCQDDSAWVVVEVGIPYRELMFRLNGDLFEASFDLIVVLYDGKRQVTGDLWREKVVTRDQTETRGLTRSVRKNIRLRARPGDLRVEVTVSEPGSGNEGHLAQEVHVPDLSKERIVVGKIWFADCPSDSDSTAWVAPNRPHLSRRFGATSQSTCIWSWVFLSGEHGEQPLVVRWEIRNDRHDEISADRVEIEPEGPWVPLRLPLPLGELWLGGYGLTLTCDWGKDRAVRMIDFEMDESTVSFGQNPDLSLALIRYIATGDEIEALENAEPADRDKAWDEFWGKRDPTPGTEENEFKIEFFRRVRYANEHFGHLEAGWKSDRGMIYIQYGPPDQVASYPHNMDGPPYEIWTYNAANRRFVFVDYEGFGRYELATPGRN